VCVCVCVCVRERERERERDVEKWDGNSFPDLFMIARSSGSVITPLPPRIDLNVLMSLSSKVANRSSLCKSFVENCLVKPNSLTIP